MKKLAVLVAGVMLVGGTVFAGDMSVSGKVAHTALKYNSNADVVDLLDGGDQYFMLDLTKELDETTTLTLGYDTDDANPDMVGSLKLNKDVNDSIEAQVAVDLDTSVGMALSEANGGDTYIKFTPSDIYSITFKPFEAGTGIGDEFETKDTQDAGGLEISFGAADAPLTLNGALNATTVGDENKFGVKGAATFTGVENLSVTGELSINNNDGIATDMALNGRGSYTMGDITLNGELLTVTTNDANDMSDIGIFAKATYGLGEVATGVTASVNGSFKMLGEELYYDGDNNRNIIGAGADLVWNGLTIANTLELASSGDKIWTDADGDATDSEMTFETEISVEF
ncbi:MAG: hypothetical protein ACQERZ_01205 [Fusobacteriota bacterium]